MNDLAIGFGHPDHLTILNNVSIKLRLQPKPTKMKQ